MRYTQYVFHQLSLKRFSMFIFTPVDVMFCALAIMIPLVLGTILNIKTAGKSGKFVDRFCGVGFLISIYFCWPIGGFLFLIVLFAKASIAWVYCREFGIIGFEKWWHITSVTFKL